MIPFFSKNLINWYKENKRDLPWRETIDPYKIWLSEIILQQTRVEQGKPYFDAFIKNYPTVFDLAKAPLDHVLKTWQGLGYYSRARNLHHTANEIVNEFNGIFPNNYTDIIKLKGIGDYTASAIASFCFKENKPVLDGNVYRVISRLYGIETPINKPKAKKEFKEVLYSLIDESKPDAFNQAIMEFGALHCKPKSPLCQSCVFNERCFALNNHSIDKFPVKIKAKKSVNRYFNYFVLIDNNQITLKKRTKKGIWFELYEFPMIESEELFHNNDSLNTITISQSKSYKHILSHQNIHAKFNLVSALPKEIDYKEDFITFESKNIQDYPIHRLMDKFLEETDWVVND